MMLLCYMLVSNGDANTCKTYYIKTGHVITAEQFIIETRNCVKNGVLTPSGLWELLRDETEKKPLTCMLVESLDCVTEEMADKQLDQLLAMELRTKPNPLESCINLRDIKEHIRRLRYSLTVHSGLYYDHNVNMINDSQWDAKATQLVNLQKRYPDMIRQVGFFDDIFHDFAGDTGMHLPWREPDMADKIYSLGKQWGVL